MLHLSRPLILASASPRRQQLLRQIGADFRVVVSNADEDAISTDTPPDEYVRRLAAMKARAVAGGLRESAIVIGADTTVVFEGDILNKPLDASDAEAMLTRLSGNAHEVFTGIALVRVGGDGQIERSLEAVARTEVRFRPLEAGEIREYVAGGSPMDKAGGYGIQDDFGAVFVQEVHGCYYNVVGLPLELLYRKLREIDSGESAPPGDS
jgi:septum formation protein